MASSDQATAASPATARVSNRVLAGERLVGVQRWTIGGFDGAAEAPAEDRRVRPEHLPTVDQLAAIEKQAHDDGYRAGLAEARESNERLASLVAGVADAVARMERDMAQTLVTVAVDLARQVVRESLVVRPEILVPLVGEALSGIARTVDPGAVYVHPADLPIVEERMREALEHAGWRAFGDDGVARGGCRLEFAGGQVDATIETRWARVMAQLERDDAWLE